MREFKISMTDDEFNAIFDLIDYEGRGILEIPRLFKAIRGEMTE